ncbi:hypothetical protein [Roseimaritima multifibrata]|nr:hypothetical protein [Roseimaritima multifibrata]
MTTKSLPHHSWQLPDASVAVDFRPLPRFRHRWSNVRWSNVRWSIASWAVWAFSLLIVHPAALAESPTRIDHDDTHTVLEDSTYVLSTRHLASQCGCIDLQRPNLRVSQLDSCGRATGADLEDCLSAPPGTLLVIYVHGNRMESCDLVGRALDVRRQVLARRYDRSTPVRWLVWSWPSEQQGILLDDARLKARRADAQSLYLAWFVRELSARGHRPQFIAYSFGARVVTGSLHALAGGSIAGFGLPGEKYQGLDAAVGLVAPAIGEDWLCTNGQHGLATTNLRHLTVLYNQRDAILKRYPLLDPGSEALGYLGPRGFAPRLDGSRLPVEFRNCSHTVGRRHAEEDYYRGSCNAGRTMAKMLEAN